MESSDLKNNEIGQLQKMIFISSGVQAIFKTPERFWSEHLYQEF